MKKILSLLFFMGLGIFMLQAQEHHWPFTADVNDAVGSANGKATTQGVSFVSDAQKGNVMQLDGKKGYVTLPLGLFDTTLTDVTITLWFNWSGGAVWQRVYSFGYSSAYSSLIRTLYLSPKDGWAGNNLHLTFEGTPGIWHDYTPVPIDSDKWYFTAFVLKDTILQLYLNDSLAVSDSLLETKPGDLYPDSANYIGKSHWNDPLFNGMITDLRLFRHALTKAEVLAIYSPTAIIKNTVTPPFVYSPGNGRIYIKPNGISDNSTVEVFNLLGREVYRTSRIYELQRAEFNSGIYIVRIKDQGKLFSSKVSVVK